MTPNDPKLAAELCLEGFDTINATFQAYTYHAKKYFEMKNWQGGREEASRRLDLYDQVIDKIAERLKQSLGERAHQEETWTAAKREFAYLVQSRFDLDCAETFFNSITRKMLSTVGVNRETEFFYLDPPHKIIDHASPKETVYWSYHNIGGSRDVIRTILTEIPFSIGYENIDRDADRISQEIDLYLWPIIGYRKPYGIDVVKAGFYRNKGVYIVGRIVVDDRIIPMIIPLVNGDHGIYADAVLLHESQLYILFSFAFSYFHVDVGRYDILIEFLRSIIPNERLSALYTSLGFNRHGKTEFYRDLHQFIHISKEQFLAAPGLEGAVMIVFTMPNFDFVFKIIKDRPCFLRMKSETPKRITRGEIKYRYNFVSHRDRAGRMVDTQEFTNLRFRKKRFSPDLLREFEIAAMESVAVSDEYVVLQHLYVQRKVVPLPLYFQNEKNPEAIRHVLVDFGYFLKDLAASGVFPADLFNIWNYGVTHWGRVVLFDYDDVLPLEQIKFREKPTPRNDIEEFEPEENWIVASEEDFFIDEIDRFSGIPEPLKGVFKSVHGDLYTLQFWKNLKEKLNQGEIFDIIPYDRGIRFHENERMI
jgi:isocitrate dehydrogenase kinase/phosphatase